MIVRLLFRLLLLMLVIAALTSSADARPRHHHHHHHKHHHRVHRIAHVRPMPSLLSRLMAEGAGRAVGYDLVSRARSYMGTNPTGWRRLWCARFMATIAPRAAARLRNPNSARDWVHAGRRIAHCQVGAIAVLTRGRRGGHVGVVTACGPRGPRIVSGNHGHRVGEGQYSARRVLAFVDPRIVGPD